MMKNIISSPYRKMKVFLILPLFAIVLYAFAKPEYRITPSGDNLISSVNSSADLQQNVVTGTVVQKDGKPLSGATIVVVGTTVGTITDQNGGFKLANVPADAAIAVSYVGFKSKALKPVYSSAMNIQMVRDTINYRGSGTIMPPPPPPPPPTTSGLSSTMTPPPIPPPPPAGSISDRGDGPRPLYLVDGKEINTEFEKIDPNTIESVKVLKDELAVKQYGEKAKNGVVLITTKKENVVKPSEKSSEVVVTGYAIDQKPAKEQFVVVEELPQFPGPEELNSWIYSKLKYPAEAVKKGIKGIVQVGFLVTSSGKIKDVAIVRSVDPLLDAEAKRVISSMPDWKPGKQGGKPVDVYMQIPIKFSLQ